MSYFNKKAVNATLIKQVLKSPMQAWHEYNNPFQGNDAMNFGSLVHAIVLGVGLEDFAKSPKFDRRTKEGKANAEEFARLNEGKIAIDETTWLEAQLCAQSVTQSHPAMSLLNKATNREKEYSFKIGEIDCKSKIDADGDGFVLDLKTTSNIQGFREIITEYHYHTQLAFYGMALGNVKNYYLIAVSTKAPYECVVYNINSTIYEGKKNVEKALGYADMIVRGIEFGNSEEIITL